MAEPQFFCGKARHFLLLWLDSGLRKPRPPETSPTFPIQGIGSAGPSGLPATAGADAKGALRRANQQAG